MRSTIFLLYSNNNCIQINLLNRKNEYILCIQNNQRIICVHKRKSVPLVHNLKIKV